MSTQEFTSHSETETKKIAADLVAKLSPFLKEDKIVLILLEGDFGAGKTQFIKGIGAALGIEESKITSPSYTYMSEYEIKSKIISHKSKLIHFDAWRIKSAEDLKLTGFQDFLVPGNIVVVEWGTGFIKTQISEPKSQSMEVIQIKFTEIDAHTRQITITKA